MINVGDRKTLGIGGLVLLVIGVFSPVAEVLWLETDYWKDGEGDGVLILILAGIALPLIFWQRARWGLWIPTVLIAIICVIDFLDIVSEELAEPGYGWLFLFGGTALLAAAAKRPFARTAPAAPSDAPYDDYP
jgi:hypothetical protein